MRLTTAACIVGFAALGCAVRLGAAPQDAQPPAIGVTVEGQLACFLEAGDGLYDARLVLSLTYRNLGADEEIFFEDQQVGVVELASPTDDLAAGWEFMPARPDEPADRLRRYTVQPGATDSRPAVVTLTVRAPDLPADAWPLGPGRHFFRVVARRMRAARGDERREFSAFGFWREFLSPVIEVNLVPPTPSQLCRDQVRPLER